MDGVVNSLFVKKEKEKVEKKVDKKRETPGLVNWVRIDW